MSNGSLFAELSQRRVFRAVSGYAVFCFVVLQIADVAFDPLGIGDEVIRFVIAGMVVVLPLVIYVSWVTDVLPNSRFHRSKGSRAWVEATFAGMGLLLLSGGIWFALQNVIEDGSAQQDPVLVQPVVQTPTVNTKPVLALRPIVVLGDHSELADHAKIVMQDIRDALSDDIELTLVDADEGIANVILDGKIRRTAEGARVSIELKRLLDGQVLWSESLSDSLSAEDGAVRYAHHVAYSVQSTLKNLGYRKYLERIGSTKNPLALDAFFRAMAANDAARIGDGNYTLAMDYHRRAIALDPEFSEPYAWLILSYAIGAQGTISAADALVEAEKLIEQISSLKQTPAVSFALAYKSLRLDLDYAAAMKHILEAEAGSFYPLNRMQVVKCQIAFAQGFVKDAIDQCTGAASTGGSLEHYVLGSLLYLAGRYEYAVEAMNSALRRGDSSRKKNRERGIHDNVGLHLLDIKARAQFHAGDASAAAQTVDSPLAREFNRCPVKYAATLALLNRKKEAQQAISQIVERDLRGTADSVAATHGFWAYFYLDDLDNAFTWLRRGVENREVFLIGAMRASPLLDGIREDPRFQAVMERVIEIERGED